MEFIYISEALVSPLKQPNPMSPFLEGGVHGLFGLLWPGIARNIPGQDRRMPTAHASKNMPP